MRVLILSNLYPPLYLGGYEIACANIARELVASGHDVKVLTSWDHLPRTEQDPRWVHRSLDLNWHFVYTPSNFEINQYEQQRAAISSFSNTLRVLEAVAEFDPDVVYVWNLMGVGGLAILDALNVSGVPWVHHLMDRIPSELIAHGHPVADGLFYSDPSLLYEDATIISMSQHLLDEILATKGIRFRDDCVNIIPGWADARDSAKHGKYLDRGVARFVSSGAVLPHKGIDIIVSAAALLLKSGCNFEVDIYGEGDLARYIDMARSLGVAGNVRFLGPAKQAELMKLYANYDAFLFPTWEREPFGFAPVEAAASGAVPIITRNCGVAERLVDRVHCIKIDRNEASLFEAMKSVSNGTIDLARIGRAAASLCSTDLSLSKCVKQIERVLELAKAKDRRKVRIVNSKLLMFLKHNLSLRLRFG